MGKKTRLREAQRQRAADEIAAVLARSKARAYPALVATYGDFKPHYHEKLEAYRPFFLRAPEKWRCRIKSRCEDDRFIDLVTFTFARYPVPAHLARAWVGENADAFDGVIPAAQGGRPDLRHWYIVVGGGGSLYNYATRRFMTRSETHHFVAAPPELTRSEHAVWYAIARAAGAEPATALDIARTGIAVHDVHSLFWQDAARFFARHPTNRIEMNDLIAYIQAARDNENGFSLQGRTLNGLRRRCQEWRRAEEARLYGGVGTWDGCDIPDVAYVTGSGEDAMTWRFRQIKSGLRLYEEGQALSHCVVTYQGLCTAGESSIWSLRVSYADGRHEPRLTIEVTRNGAIVQCRGYANRLPRSGEAEIIKRWADEFGLIWRALGQPALAA